MSGLEDKVLTNPDPTTVKDNVVIENKNLFHAKKKFQIGTSPTKFREQLSISSRNNAPELGTTPQQILEHSSQSSNKSARQSSTSPGKNVGQTSTSPGKASNRSGNSLVQNEIQRRTASGDDLVRNNSGTGHSTNIISPVSPMGPSATNNTAQLTATPGSSGSKQPFFPPPTTYNSPYAVANDPYGHYTNAKHRVLGIESPSSDISSRSQAGPSSMVPKSVRLEQTFRKRYPTATNEQIMEAVSHTMAHPKYMQAMESSSNAPTGGYVSGMGSGPFTPINGRSGSFEANQNQGRSYYPEIPSSNFGPQSAMSINEDDAATPLEKPVVQGRIVQRHRKRSRSRYEDDGDYVEAKRPKSGQKRFSTQDFEDSQERERGQTNSPFRRVAVPQDNEDNMCQPARFRAPGSAPGNTPMSGPDNRSGRYMSDDDYLEDSGPELFVSDDPPRRSSNSRRPSDYDSRLELGSNGNHQTPRPRSGQKGYFNVFGQKLEPSRYSGAAMPWDVSVDPEMVDQSEVSDASLLKRNIARGEGKKICKRGYGASDPENIAIVNMKEFDDLSFEEIAKRLNEKRIAEGHEPSLSAVGVNSRYNRTAPLLFSAQGKEFIPLSKRKGKAREIFEANRDGALEWTNELDIALVGAVKEVDAARWNTVALLFEEKTGKKLSASAAAVRHNLL